jgi:DNA-binding FadR family transcriptional regulator
MAGSASRANEISDSLRDEILRGQYRAGERLPSERDLATRFDTNRGAIREALKKLEQLGIAEVRPGGARVAPVAEASLDVVGHLLDLQTPPDLNIVNQVLQVGSVVMSAWARLAVENGSDDELAAILASVARIREASDAPTRRQATIDFGFELIGATKNMVAGLVHRGLLNQLVERLPRMNLHPDLDRKRFARSARDLEHSFDKRDSAAAAEAVYQMIEVLHQGVREALLAALETHKPQAEGIDHAIQSVGAGSSR